MFAVTVLDYNEAIRFYVDTLGFRLLEDTDRGNGKRWVRVAPPCSNPDTCILLALAVGDRQRASVGNQTGGRVFIFIETDNFDADYQRMTRAGVRFTDGPRDEAYGRVGVFEDLYGNRFDLIQPPRRI